jgi:predicted CxxxxCH...CXXCH cytochrome family protein
VAAAAALAAGCDSTRPVEPTADLSDCARCHGYPPPPFIAGGTSHTTSTNCSLCHPGTVQVDNVTLVPGGLHMNGTVEAAASHAIPYVAEHPAAALANIASCRVCHGDDFAGGATGVSCTACHASSVSPSPGFADWTANCTFCHGTRTPDWTIADLALAAPPDAVVGGGDQTNANPGVGAHQAHLVAGTFANALACTSCHTVPAGTGALTHFQGNGAQAAIDFSATATKGVSGAAYAGGNCTVYCHGSGTELANPAGTASPAWTSSAGVACGDCHGLPPPSGPTFLTPNAHEFHVTTQAQACSRCHPVPPGEKGSHVNGTKDVVVQLPAGGTQTIAGWDCTGCHGALGISLSSHPLPYVATHTTAALASLATCASCHGADYGGGLGGAAPSCNACHGGLGYADWKTNCTFCHGTRTPSFAGTPVWLPAPPQSVIVTADQTTSNPRIGAHQKHVGNGSTLSNGVACTECHPAAADLGHVGGSGAAQLAWGPLATNAGAAASMTSGTCANYCHGATLPGAAGRTAPAWAPPSAMTCGSCHEADPTTGQHPSQRAQHSSFQCYICHGGSYVGGTTADKSLHFDGTVSKDASLNWQTSPVKSCDPACHNRKNW